jgi:hypothetical protein
VEVDFDLLYDEDANIGQKIKLSEAIERALRRMGCPAPLLAHQIQGLDYPALFPVVQWLVKRVLATREEFGDRLRTFSLHVYAAEGFPPLDVDVAAAPGVLSRRAAALRRRFPTQRRLRRAPGAPPPRERATAVRWVLAEYGHRFAGAPAAATQPRARVAAAEAPPSAQPGAPLSQAAAARAAMANLTIAGAPGGGGSATAAAAAAADAAADAAAADMAAAMAEVGDADGALSGSAAARLVSLRGAEVAAAAAAAAAAEDPTGIGARTAALARQLDAAQRALAAEASRVAEADAVAAAAQQAADAAAAARDAVLAHNARCTSECASLDGYMGGVDADTVARVTAAVRDSAALKAAEAAFKADCRRQLAALRAAVAAADGAGDGNAGEAAPPQTEEEAAEEARLAAVAAAHAAEEARLGAARAAAAQRALGVSLLQRRLDELPGRPELAQYERRFRELADVVSDKLGETRRYFAVYNAAAEALRLAGAETALLNKLRAQYEGVRAGSGEARAAFAAQLATVAAGVAENARRAEERAAKEAAALAEATDAHAAAVARQRTYFATVKRFQEECAAGEALRRQLEAAEAPPADA